MNQNGYFMRYKLQELLLRPDHQQSDVDRFPQHGFVTDKVCIINAAGSSYPEVRDDGEASGWFKIEPWSFDDSELCLVHSAASSIRGAIRGDAWDVPHPSFNCDTTHHLLRIFCLPFDAIRRLDFGPDLYGDGPRLYCDFIHGGAPYSRSRVFHKAEDKRFSELEPSARGRFYPSTMRWLF